MSSFLSWMKGSAAVNAPSEPRSNAAAQTEVLDTAAAVADPALTPCQQIISAHLRALPTTLDEAYARICSLEETRELPVDLKLGEPAAARSGAACYDLSSAVPSWCAHRSYRCHRCEAINSFSSVSHRDSVFGRETISVASKLTQCRSERARTGRVPTLPIELIGMCVEAFLDGISEHGGGGNGSLPSLLIRSESWSDSEDEYRMPEAHATILRLLHTSKFIRALVGLRLVEHVKRSTTVVPPHSEPLESRPLLDAWSLLDSTVAALLRCQMLDGIQDTQQYADEPEEPTKEFKLNGASIRFFKVEFLTATRYELEGYYYNFETGEGGDGEIRRRYEWKTLGSAQLGTQRGPSGTTLDVGSVHEAIMDAFYEVMMSDSEASVYKRVCDWARREQPVEVAIKIQCNLASSSRDSSVIWQATGADFTCSYYEGYNY